MGMPDLDPERYRRAYLVNPAHTLPVPGRASFFPADGMVVDVQDPYWRLPLVDGSLTFTAPEVAPVQEVAAVAESPLKAIADEMKDGTAVFVSQPPNDPEFVAPRDPSAEEAPSSSSSKRCG